MVLESLNEPRRPSSAASAGRNTVDRSQLAAVRAAAPKGAEEYVILPEQISKELLGPVVKRGDDERLDPGAMGAVGLIDAEERGDTQANRARSSQGRIRTPALRQHGRGPRPRARRQSRLGAARPGGGRQLRRVYDRNLGANSPLKLERGLNRLWARAA